MSRLQAFYRGKWWLLILTIALPVAIMIKSLMLSVFGKCIKAGKE